MRQKVGELFERIGGASITKSVVYKIVRKIYSREKYGLFLIDIEKFK